MLLGDTRAEVAGLAHGLRARKELEPALHVPVVGDAVAPFMASVRDTARVTPQRDDLCDDDDVWSSNARIPGRVPVPPLRPEWLIVDELPLFHRVHLRDDQRGTPIVHVHGFGISGTYLEPTAAVLAAEHPTYVPDLPGMGRSLRPKHGLDLPGLARALVAYCDVVGVEKPVLVGNSLGCPIIIEVAASFPGRIASAVLVSPAGGPNNQPMPRALRQMALDGLREPPSMLPIAVRDYLRFGAMQSLSLFKAMTRYPTLDNLHLLDAPTLVIAGARDPLVRVSRAFVLAELPHVTAVKVPGAHALNFTSPQLIAELVEAHVAGRPVLAGPLARDVAQPVEVYDTASGKSGADDVGPR